MNVLKEYPASKAFWYSEKRTIKEYAQKKTYPINMSKIKRKLEHDIALLETPKSDLEEPEKYKKFDNFLTDLLTIFRNTEIFSENTKKHKYSQACQRFVMQMLQKERIFQNGEDLDSADLSSIEN